MGNNMRHVAIVFSTTGPVPAKGGRFKELQAVELVNGKASGQSFRETFRNAEGDQGRSFAEAFSALDDFIGEATVVIHDLYEWKRFLRVELAGINRPNAKRLFDQTFDVSTWAQQHYPRKRKDLKSIAKNLGVQVATGLSGLPASSELLVLIAMRTCVNSGTKGPTASSAHSPEIRRAEQVQASTNVRVANSPKQTELIGKAMRKWFSALSKSFK